MKAKITLFLCLTICLFTFSSTLELSKNLILSNFEKTPTKEVFKAWHYAFNKSYDLNSEEGIIRYRVFKENIKYIKQTNAEQSDYKLGLGPFADATYEEFIAGKNMNKGLGEKNDINDLDMNDYETDDVDPTWNHNFKDFTYLIKSIPQARLYKNFGFLCTLDSIYLTLAALIETHLALQGETNVKISTQNLFDCSEGGFNQGLCQVVPYLPEVHNQYLRYKGFYTVQTYPILNEIHEKQSCKDEERKFDYTGDLTYCTALKSICLIEIKKEIVNKGPYLTRVIVTRAMQHWNSGVLSADQCVDPDYFDYGLVIHFGKTNIKVMFGYGKDFAEGGFIRFGRGFSKPLNEGRFKRIYHSCGIESEMITPRKLRKFGYQE